MFINRLPAGDPACAIACGWLHLGGPAGGRLQRAAYCVRRVSAFDVFWWLMCLGVQRVWSYIATVTCRDVILHCFESQQARSGIEEHCFLSNLHQTYSARSVFDNQQIEFEDKKNWELLRGELATYLLANCGKTPIWWRYWDRYTLVGTLRS